MWGLFWGSAPRALWDLRPRREQHVADKPMTPRFVGLAPRGEDLSRLLLLSRFFVGPAPPRGTYLSLFAARRRSHRGSFPQGINLLHGCPICIVLLLWESRPRDEVVVIYSRRGRRSYKGSIPTVDAFVGVPPSGRIMLYFYSSH